MTKMIMLSMLLVGLDATAGDLEFGYTPTPAPDEQPSFMVTPSLPLARLVVEVEAGGQVYSFEESGVPAGQTARFSWARDPSVTSADVYVRGEFVAGHTEQVQLPISYDYGGQLSVDLSGAEADLAARTLSLSVSGPVERAEIVSYGARRAVLDRTTLPVGQGPGTITLPWQGDPEDVVLLDVTLHGASSWASFTFSPWFLDIPHEDVLFASGASEIPASETWKLESTLRALQEVLEKYGEVVPVKVYIAGCTDTVGDAAHNRDLSQRRARAIASWLRSHGYSEPIFYHGYGENFLAVRTGDGVDEPANRRVLYMVSSNPPPSSAGIPSAQWRAL
jgi:outer membrane protein OmpA-like peptidoglycan-associated protein